jgi:hypothetical protein
VRCQCCGMADVWVPLECWEEHYRGGEVGRHCGLGGMHVPTPQLQPQAEPICRLTFVPTHVNDADDASRAGAPVGQAQAAAAEALRHAAHVAGAVGHPRVGHQVGFFPLCQGIGAVQSAAQHERE